VNDYFRGFLFHLGREVPDLYKKAIDWLALYSSTQLKNGSDVVPCLFSEDYVGPEDPVMPTSPRVSNKRVCEFKIADLVKIEQVLKTNLPNIFTVFMALFDTKVKSNHALLNFNKIN